MNEASIRSTLMAAPTWAMLLLTGLLLGISFPPNPVGMIAAVGLVPLLIALERASNLREAILWSYLSFALFSILTTWWVGSWQSNADPFLMISSILLMLIHPLFFVVPIALYFLVRRMAGLPLGLLFLVLLWCGGEYLHALGDASYPWLTLGNTQTYFLPYIQFAEITGVWGISLMLLLINGAVTWMLLAVPSEKRQARRYGFAIIAFALFAPLLYDVFGLSSQWIEEPAGKESISVTIVQPNQNPWDKWRAADTVDHILDNLELSLAAASSGRRADAYLWAENAIPYPITHPDYAGRANTMQQAVQALGATVITGFPDYVEHPEGEHAPSSRRTERFNDQTEQVDTVFWDYYNSIGIFQPGQGLVASYHKSQLVPFGERIPFIDLAPFLAEMMSWDVGISSWGKGRDVHPLEMAVGEGTQKTNTSVGAMVCFESVYPNLVREFVAEGAEFLTIVTNDGWYLGTPGPLQHERFAMLRAIETRRDIARAANTGISCFINARGEILEESEEGARETLTGDVVLRSTITPYVRYGNWLPILCLIGAAGIALLGSIRATRRVARPERLSRNGVPAGDNRPREVDTV